MKSDGLADHRARQFGLPALFALIAVTAVGLATYRLSPRAFCGVVLIALGLTCAIWKTGRYRQRGYRELASEVGHLVFGPSLLAAVTMLIVGLGLVVSVLWSFFD